MAFFVLYAIRKSFILLLIMLRKLSIQNYTIIEELEIDFSSHLKRHVENRFRQFPRYQIADEDQPACWLCIEVVLG